MSAPLYLTSLKLRQFRTFAELDIDLPERPGVLIVQGSNGLGKSSLIHGVEWLLTDQIDEFRNADQVRKAGRYLCKWKKPAGEATSVSLGFSDGQTLTRSLASRKSTRSDFSGPEDIGLYLKRPDWSSDIQDLSRYLLLTHFLAQTSLSRMAHRKGDERFDILRDAARSTVEEGIAKALHGPGTTVQAKAFTTMIDRLRAETEALEQALTLEDTAWAEARISGALDPSAAAEAGQGILDRLARAGQPADVDPTDLEALATAIDQAAIAHRARRSELDLAARLRAAFAEAGEAQSATSAALDSVASRLSSWPEVESEARAMRDKLVANRADALRAVADAEARITQLQQLTSDRARQDDQSRRFEASEAAVNDWATRHRTAVLALARAERRLGLTNRISQRIDFALGRRTELSSRLDALQTLVAVHVRLGQASVQLRGLLAVDEHWDAALAEAERAVELSGAEVIRLGPGVTALREATDAISEAVVSIVVNLPETACECPVCATTFTEPQRLREKASQAAARLAPELNRLTNALDMALKQHADDLRLLERREAVAKAIKEAKQAVETETKHWRAGLEQEALDAASDLASLLTLIQQVEAERDEASLAADRLRRRLGVLTRRGQIRYASVVVETARARDAALSDLRFAETSKGELERSCALLRERIAQVSADLLGAEEIDPIALQAEIEVATRDGTAARSAQSATEAALATADAEINRLTTERSALEAESGALRKRSGELQARRDALVEQWTRLATVGELGDASGRALIAAEAVISEVEDQVRSAGIRLTALREGRLAWSKQQGHASALARLRVLVDAPETSPRDDVRATAEVLIVARRSRRATVERAKGVAASASDRITEQLNAFNNDYIQPLGRLMTQINRAILCDPGIGIRFKVNGKRVEQASVKTDQPSDLGDVDPMLVHSEGQMAALGVSLLCAASLTFPWSRWKALILDDPLQHNDAIHASAFADFIGNLVEAKQYQVILSSHDAAQAEFLQRKFSARDISCKVVSLLGMGPRGVEEVIRETGSRLRLAG